MNPLLSTIQNVLEQAPLQDDVVDESMVEVLLAGPLSPETSFSGEFFHYSQFLTSYSYCVELELEKRAWI